MSQPPHEPTTQPDPFDQDESIPLLTEVVMAADRGAGLVSLAAATAPAPAALSSPRSTAVAAPAPAVAAPAPALPGLPTHTATVSPQPATASPQPADARTLAELAARIEHGVTSRMLEQAGPMLEASLQSMVAPLIEQAAVQIAQDLHDAFSHLVRDLVARAVAEELALLQAHELDGPDAGSATSTTSRPPPLDAQAGPAGSQ
jgi:hypothetical protein